MILKSFDQLDKPLWYGNFPYFVPAIFMLTSNKFMYHWNDMYAYL